MTLTLGKKLGGGFGVILALMVASAMLTYTKASAVKETQEFIVTLLVPTISALKDLQKELNQTQSKSRQSILAGSDAGRWAAGKKSFDEAWDEIGKDVARLDELSPRWTVQANRDRLAATKQMLPAIRELQESIMKQAASGEHDAVAKAGNDSSDKATPAVEAVKKPLRAGGLTSRAYPGKHRRDECAESVDEPDHGDHNLSGAGPRNFHSYFSQPQHFRGYAGGSGPGRGH